MSPRKRKRVVLDICQKLKIVERVSEGESPAKLAAESGIGITTVRDIVKKKDELLDFASKTDNLMTLRRRKSMKGSPYSDVDNAVYQWYQQKRREGVAVNGPMICEQARLFHQQLRGDGTFSASSGWLTSFKDRHGIRASNMVGEKYTGDLRAIDEFKKMFKWLIDQYDLTPDQVYNADESGFLWKSLPKFSAVKTKESCGNYEAGKERMTIMCCANASGGHKLKLTCVGVDENPFCVNGMLAKCIPVDYFKASSVFMTSDIFKCWFHSRFIPEVRNYLKSKGLPPKAMLLIDSASYHPNPGELKSDDGRIFAIILPQNLNSWIQPIEQGVSVAVKRFYHRELLVLLTKKGSSMIDYWNKLGLNEAIQLLDCVWKSITKSTISWSWRHLYDELGDGFEDLDELDIDDAESSEFIDTIRSIIAENYLFSGVRTDSIKEWLSLDDQLEECETSGGDPDDSTKTPICTNSAVDTDDSTETPVCTNSAVDTDDSSKIPVCTNSAVDPDDFTMTPVCTISEFSDWNKSEEEHVIDKKCASLTSALKAAETLLHYLVQEDDTSMEHILCVRKIRADIKKKILGMNE
ncbi:jerky protein homolog-like [Ischnura elegans]|uniref:jerky protein homolog-like n=1 Tax=Ischnura elegans TaxID=197161 RepID=UPI001ED88E54|nr:jerky protein homolog-like [Ischnura elegans]